MGSNETVNRSPEKSYLHLNSWNETETGTGTRAGSGAWAVVWAGSEMVPVIVSVNKAQIYL